jgi:hypothetical protein
VKSTGAKDASKREEKVQYVQKNSVVTNNESQLLRDPLEEVHRWTGVDVEGASSVGEIHLDRHLSAFVDFAGAIQHKPLQMDRLVRCEASRM